MEKLSKDLFVEQVIQGISVRVSEARLSLRPGDENSNDLVVDARLGKQAYPLVLGDAYALYVEDRVTVDVAVNRYASFIEILRGKRVEALSWGQAASILALRPRRYLPGDETDALAKPGFYTFRTGDEDDPLRIYPSYGPITLESVLVFPTANIPVTEEMTRRWAVNLLGVRDRAERQTLQRIPSWKELKVEGHSLWKLQDNAGFAAAAVAYAECIDKLPIPKRYLWLAAPCRSIVYAWEAQSQHAPVLKIAIREIMRSVDAAVADARKLQGDVQQIEEVEEVLAPQPFLYWPHRAAVGLIMSDNTNPVFNQTPDPGMSSFSQN